MAVRCVWCFYGFAEIIMITRIAMPSTKLRALVFENVTDKRDDMRTNVLTG